MYVCMYNHYPVAEESESSEREPFVRLSDRALGDVGESPGESCLFSLTPSADPGIGLSGDRV